MKSIQCDACQNIFKGKFKRDVLGFPKYTCPNCQNVITKPLTDGYRAFYWLIGIVMWYQLFFDTSNFFYYEHQLELISNISRFALIGLFLIVPFVVLWIDYKKKKNAPLTKLSKFLYEKYGDLFQPNDTGFRIKNIDATFSAISLGDDEESYYDIQIEFHPPCECIYTAIIKFEDFINLIDKLEKLPEENWPINN